jgi:hypothetical protein
VYNPIFTTLFADGLVTEDYFSILIERNTSGDSGYLALGGVPDVAFTQNFTSTPIIVTNIEGYPVTYDFYTININSMVLNGKAIAESGGASIEYIVDSGKSIFSAENRVDYAGDSFSGHILSFIPDLCMS